MGVLSIEACWPYYSFSSISFLFLAVLFTHTIAHCSHGYCSLTPFMCIVHTHYSQNVVKFDLRFSLPFFNPNQNFFSFILKPYSFFNPNLSTKRFQILDLEILKFKPAQAHVNKVSHLSYIIFSTSTMKNWYGVMGSALCPSDLVWVHIL